MTRVRWYVLLAAVVPMVTIGLRLDAWQERDAGGFKAPTAALERGRAVYVLNHCHFCHGVDLTRATMGAANLSQSPFVGTDEDGNMIGPLVKAGLPNLQTAMPSYAELTRRRSSISLDTFTSSVNRRGSESSVAWPIRPPVIARPGPTMPSEGVSPTAGQAAHLKLLENYTAANVQDLVAYLGASR